MVFWRPFDIIVKGRVLFPAYNADQLSPVQARLRAFAFPVSIVFILLYGLFLQLTHAVQSDIAWLTQGARILYEGGNFLDDFFETNPPFNTVYYIPVVIIQDFFHLSLQSAIIAYFMPQVVLLWCGIYLMVRRAIVLYAPADIGEYLGFLKISFLLIMYLSLVLTREHLGQRDIMAGIGTYAASAGIYLLTLRDKSMPWVVWPSIIFGTALALLKPHWGVIIVGMYLHRMWRQRRIWVVFDADFLAVSLLPLLYAYLSMIFYPEFFTFILPDVLNFYATKMGLTPLAFFAATMIFGISPWLFYLVAKDFTLHRAQLHFIIALNILALISIFPVLLQAKGFMYHYIVACYFTITSLMLTIGTVVTRCFAFVTKNRQKAENLTIAFTMMFCAVLYFLIVKFSDYPKRYPSGPLHQIIHTHSRKPTDSYFIFFENMGTIFPTNVYIDRAYGSRFSTLWSLIALYEMKLNDAPAYHAAMTKYARLFAEDLRRFKPKVILIQQDLYHYYTDDVQTALDPIAMYFEDPYFRREWAHYELAETRSFERSRYVIMAPYKEDDKTATVKVYVRKDGE